MSGSGGMGVSARNIGRSHPGHRPQQRNKSGGEPLQVNRGCGEEGLYAHVVETAADGAGETVPSLRLAVKAFRAPAVALVKTSIFGGPAVAPSPGSEEGGIVVADHERLVDPALRQAEARQRTSRTVPGAGVKEAAVLDPPAGRKTLPRGHLTMSCRAS